MNVFNVIDERIADQADVPEIKASKERLDRLRDLGQSLTGLFGDKEVSFGYRKANRSTLGFQRKGEGQGAWAGLAADKALPMDFTLQQLEEATIQNS